MTNHSTSRRGGWAVVDGLAKRVRATAPVTIRMHDETIARYKLIARREGRTFSDVVRDALDAYDGKAK